MKLVHKYLRRLIVWAQTPSDEEAEARSAFERHQKRQRLCRNVLPALHRNSIYSEWIGISAREKIELIEDIRRIGRNNEVSEIRIDALVESVNAHCRVDIVPAGEFTKTLTAGGQV